METGITRRDFLKLGWAGLFGLLFAQLETGSVLALQEDAPDPTTVTPDHQGRVAYHCISSYHNPLRDDRQVASYRQDEILDLLANVKGGLPDDHNRRWYRINDSEFIFSGDIQPVQTKLNPVVTNLPETGSVGELTVPYTDCWWAINRRPFPGPRLYYATTHWIEDLITDGRDNSLWYKAYDHHFNAYYYIQPTHIRILQDQDLAPLSPQVPPEEKTIQVCLAQQLLLAFEGERLVFNCRVSTGRGEFATPQGWFTTFHKRPTAHMVGGVSHGAYYDLMGVPWDTYITENGVAFHGTFWHNDYGTPHSHGCINMTPEDARTIYRWTLPQVPPTKRFLYQPGQGTSVQIVHSETLTKRRN